MMYYTDIKVTMNCVHGCLKSVGICIVDALNTCHVFLLIIQLQDGADTMWNRSPSLGLDRSWAYVVFINILQNNIMFNPIH